MKQLIKTLNRHYIVCGYGRMGRQIVRDLRARGEPFVVIDANPNVEEEMLEPYFATFAWEKYGKLPCQRELFEKLGEPEAALLAECPAPIVDATSGFCLNGNQ